MIPYSQMCNVCNVCNATLLLLSIFIGNCLFFQEKLLERKSANYWPPGNLIEAITNAAVKRGSQGGQSNGDSIGSYPVLPTNNTRIAANCCDITTSEQQGVQRRSSERRERYKQCSNALFVKALQTLQTVSEASVTHFRVRVSTF